MSALLASLLALLAASPAAAQPAAVAAGRFVGSWSRVEPGQRMALLIDRDASGAFKLRFYWHRESLDVDTAWQERTEYVYKGYPGAIELEVDQERSDDTHLFVRYHREQRGPRQALLTEDGTLELFRIGRFGRTLVWRISPVTRRLTVGEPLSPAEADSGPMLDSIEWHFNKEAERLLEWDEFYW
ncbi:MAG: hypothetical protein D6718_06680 [Acidobacteria bacterium]|nr:MAG: hypothetical protein D6718_06680 [Acidobacteriota bacterium]